MQLEDKIKLMNDRESVLSKNKSERLKKVEATIRYRDNYAKIAERLKCAKEMYNKIVHRIGNDDVISKDMLSYSGLTIKNYIKLIEEDIRKYKRELKKLSYLYECEIKPEKVTYCYYYLGKTKKTDRQISEIASIIQDLYSNKVMLRDIIGKGNRLFLLNVSYIGDYIIVTPFDTKETIKEMIKDKIKFYEFR